MADAKKIQIAGVDYNIKDQTANTNINNIKSAGACQATITIGRTTSKGVSALNNSYICGNSTSDLLIFRNAINALPASGGKIVILDGVYEISEELLCHGKNVIFEGMGIGNTIIKYNSNSYTVASGLIKSTSGNIVIKDIEFNINGHLCSEPIDEVDNISNINNYLFLGNFDNSKLLIDNCYIHTTDNNYIDMPAGGGGRFIAGFKQVIMNNSTMNIVFKNTTTNEDDTTWCYSILCAHTDYNINNCTFIFDINNVDDFHLSPSHDMGIYHNIQNSYFKFTGSTIRSEKATVDAGNDCKINNCIIIVDAEDLIFSRSYNGKNVYSNCRITCRNDINLNANKVINCTISCSTMIISGAYICIMTNNILHFTSTASTGYIKGYRNQDLIVTNNISNKSLTSIPNASSSSIIKDNIQSTNYYDHVLGGNNLYVI